MKKRTTAAAVLTAAALTASLAACATETDSGASAPEQNAVIEGSAAARYTTPLADVCPSTVSIQWNWWPQADHGWTYQLIGDAGEVDAEKYTYTGPLGSTGIDLEIRAGGPATGGQLPLAQLYSDDSITFGITTTDDSIGASQDFPTVSVFTYAVKTPLVFFWGDDEWDFKNLTEVKESGETVLAWEGAPYLDVLTSLDLLDPAQIDASYKGDPARFVLEEGKVLQQGLLTSEVYKYEHDVPAWGKPVKYVSVGDEYDAYTSQVSIRADQLEAQRPCLEKLVPLFQQAAVDYAHDPAPTNQVLLDVVDQLDGSGWELTPGIVDWSSTIAVEEGIVANSPDGVFGSFDLDRLNEYIKVVAPLLSERGQKVAPGLTAEDFVTNEFLDPEIAL
ncbi:hypothetical protein [Ruicaihuangia caeni]|uniref:ABC transporter substrate-binding protein n=1 Tax=Ruicaihuangia caeni TaxID=3042517 RepID=A0AAW6TAE4_9MICO|nr:hypothetical protein [Klugiella sp. YN-L-19]MDI2099379.1 hypothetical protein [Klugiella sp. YN-L-19]